MGKQNIRTKEVYSSRVVRKVFRTLSKWMILGIIYFWHAGKTSNQYWSKRPNSEIKEMHRKSAIGQAGKRFKTFCHFLMLLFLNYVVVISNVCYASGVIIVIIVIVNFIDDVVCFYWEVCVPSMINTTKCPLFNPILHLIVKYSKTLQQSTPILGKRSVHITSKARASHYKFEGFLSK